MARASRQARRNRAARDPTPGWVWLVTGLSLGLFVALLVHLRETAPNSKQPAAAPSHRAEQSASSNPQPRFEFYTILPEREVRVADHELRAGDKAQAPPAIARPSPAVDSGSKATSYLLQVGSFRKYEEADRLKAKLALMGLEAEIQTVRVASDENWHRVRLGPFSDRGTLQATRETLRRNQLDALVMRNRG